MLFKKKERTKSTERISTMFCKQNPEGQQSHLIMNKNYCQLYRALFSQQDLRNDFMPWRKSAVPTTLAISYVN